MAKPRLPPERYKRVAKELGKYSPKIAALAKKKTLTPSEKRAITRAEDKAHEWTRGSQTLIPISAREIKKLKDKSLLVPGFNAVVDRNTGKNPKAIVREGNLIIQDNGRDIHVIPVKTNNQEKIADLAEGIFKGRKRRNVWIRFVNGRGDRGFADAKSLLRYLVMIWEKYVPLWTRENVQLDEIIVGFEVYERGKAPPPKPTKKRKVSKKKPVKKTRGPSKIVKAVKSRFKKTPKKAAPKFKPKKQAKLKRVSKSKAFKPKKQAKVKPVPKSKPRKLGTKRNVRKTTKNRRH